MSKYILIPLLTTGTIISCPMGLGKNYANKPTFFHNDFYNYKKATKNRDTDKQNLVVKKESAPEERRSL